MEKSARYRHVATTASTVCNRWQLAKFFGNIWHRQGILVALQQGKLQVRLGAHVRLFCQLQHGSRCAQILKDKHSERGRE